MATYEDYQKILANSIGTENYYRHRIMKGLLYTDGVKAMAETLECYWLIDVVASHMPKVLAYREYYDGKCSATLDVVLETNQKRRGADLKILLTLYGCGKEMPLTVVSQRIGMTDIPRDTKNKKTIYKLYLGDGPTRSSMVLFLTSEY